MSGPRVGGHGVVLVRRGWGVAFPVADYRGWGWHAQRTEGGGGGGGAFRGGDCGGWGGHAQRTEGGGGLVSRVVPSSLDGQVDGAPVVMVDLDEAQAALTVGGGGDDLVGVAGVAATGDAG